MATPPAAGGWVDVPRKADLGRAQQPPPEWRLAILSCKGSDCKSLRLCRSVLPQLLSSVVAGKQPQTIHYQVSCVCVPGEPYLSKQVVSCRHSLLTPGLGEASKWASTCKFPSTGSYIQETLHIL